MPKTVKRKQNSETFVEVFLNILNTIKIFHWKTKSYALHKATDDLHSKLSGLVDSFVEVMLGKTEGRIKGKTHHSLFHCETLGEFKKEIYGFRSFLIGLSNSSLKSHIESNSDLFTIRDEMLKEINQFLYLSTFI